MRQSSFSFAFVTDTHIQPELGATEGVHRALAAVRSERPDFALMGGDLVMDAAAVSRSRAESVYDLWQQAASDAKLTLHYTPGNHDTFLTQGAEKRSPSDPEYGKGFWKRRLGLDQTYGTFDHQGWRFIRLDSCRITESGAAEGGFDKEQLSWLDTLLRKTPRTMPIVVWTHYPIITAFQLFNKGTTEATPAGLIAANGRAFTELIERHNVRAVFQGHTHVVEEISYLGTHYITGGAVCGDWWKGLRLGRHPEGFVVATVTGDTLTWRYQTYGWKARSK